MIRPVGVISSHLARFYYIGYLRLYLLSDLNVDVKTLMISLEWMVFDALMLINIQNVSDEALRTSATKFAATYIIKYLA